MKEFRYLKDATTLTLDASHCVGCGNCATVCPHGVFNIENRIAVIVDKDGCMECGACAKNCPENALSLTPGVGCASYILQKWLKGEKAASCGCSDCC